MTKRDSAPLPDDKPVSLLRGEAARSPMIGAHGNSGAQGLEEIPAAFAGANHPKADPIERT